MKLQFNSKLVSSRLAKNLIFFNFQCYDTKMVLLFTAEVDLTTHLRVSKGDVLVYSLVMMNGIL